MNGFISIIERFKNLEQYQFVSILIAILIYLVFELLNKQLAYLTIKIFKPKYKKKSIKKYGAYKPAKAFYSLLGLYLAVLFLKSPFNLSEYVMNIVNKIFKILTIFIFTNGIANVLTTNSNFINKIKNKINPDVEDSRFKFLLKAVRVIVYIIGGFLIITELGFNLNGLVAGFGIGGIILTLAAQDTAKNLFAGIMIFLDKPYKVGDWIQIDSLEGTVEDMTFRSTRIRSFENSIINIPNLLISEKSIINWSKMEKRRIKTNLCLVLDTPLNKVEKVQTRIKEMLINHYNITDNTIIVKFDNITENGINLFVSCYTNSVDYNSFLEEKEKINFKIMKILDEEKVELAYDTKTIFVKDEEKE